MTTAQNLENRLRFEKSPYLKQHETNPVAWFPWSEEAFLTARELGRPIFLSVGYSTCYWCHVMEQDSFESEDVAELLNEHFVCIKVDREERPDIDQVYMDAVVGISGHGGWPMSVFLTPDKMPFFGGTFFPKDQFIPLLKKISEVWSSDPDSITRSAEQIYSFLKNQSPQTEGEISLEEAFRAALSYYRKSFDEEFGGFGNAPKFPQPGNIELLLRIWRRTGDDGAKAMALQTLEALCRGGIMDQIGGGFHRYATDREWLIPHFEKMLYDNALLGSALLRAYQATGERWCLTNALSTLRYVLRDLRLPSGGITCAEDAGEVRREGEFYVWEMGELEHLLSEEELALATELYGVSSQGNFEDHTNILALKRDIPWEKLEEERVQSLNNKLLRARSSRERPLRDTKVLTSWMSLFISTLADAFTITGESAFLDAARQAEKFQREHLAEGALLKRSFCDGETKYAGFLEDYSYLIDALLKLYSVTGEVRFFTRAEELQRTQDELFWDSERGGYFFAPQSSADLIVRKKDFNDGATPSGNSIAALNLLKLFQLTGKSAYYERFDALKKVMAPFAAKYPAAYATFLSALDYEHENFRSVVVAAQSDEEWRAALSKFATRFHPNLLVIRANSAGPLLAQKTVTGATQYSLCDRSGCMVPETDIEKTLEQLVSVRTISL